MQKPTLFLVMALCVLGCNTPQAETTQAKTNTTDGMKTATSTTMKTATPKDMGGVVDATDLNLPKEELRPNVQIGQQANATDQKPAFPAQTRAPQPAKLTSISKTVVAKGLEIPWGIAPLPDGRLLVTERAGRLRMVGADGTLSPPLKGAPNVAATGQGGLLDVAISPNFTQDRLVFLSYSESRSGGKSATTIARATLATNDRELNDVTVIHRQEPPHVGGRHFGSRIVFDRSGALFATFGDRGSAFDDAQSSFNSVGAVIRINPDGTIPKDNPFADGSKGSPAVWSWGHRNIQSATIGPKGALWTVEHGPRGGDELNRPEAGINYGWPIITYGIDYGGGKVGEGLTTREGLAQPVYYWDPVIAPSGMATYTGDLFKEWQGSLLIGGLRAKSVVRLTLRGGQVYTEEWIPMDSRVRSLAIGQDGAVLVGTDSGEIVALRPR